MSLGPVYVLFGEVSVQDLCPFFDWIVCLFGGGSGFLDVMENCWEILNERMAYLIYGLKESCWLIGSE